MRELSLARAAAHGGIFLSARPQDLPRLPARAAKRLCSAREDFRRIRLFLFLLHVLARPCPPLRREDEPGAWPRAIASRRRGRQQRWISAAVFPGEKHSRL